MATKFFFDTYKKVPGEIISQEQIMEWKEDTYDVLSSEFLNELSDVEQSGEYKVQEHECRFDNISYDLYKDSSLWWIIMEYNDYIDWNININEELKIPDFRSIQFLVQNLVTKQNKLNME